jgi:hypothetical protein
MTRRDCELCSKSLANEPSRSATKSQFQTHSYVPQWYLLRWLREWQSIQTDTLRGGAQSQTTTPSHDGRKHYTNVMDVHIEHRRPHGLVVDPVFSTPPPLRPDLISTIHGEKPDDQWVMSYNLTSFLNFLCLCNETLHSI